MLKKISFTTIKKYRLLKGWFTQKWFTQKWYSHEGASKTDTEEKKLLNKVIIFLFFLHTQSILVAS